MDLSTTYLGLSLKNPLIVASSGLTSNVENIKKCEEYGAAAVVLKSLFEEQIMADSNILLNQDDMYFWYPEAMDYVKSFTKEEGIGHYLDFIRNCKKNVKIPVIASINCVSPFEWTNFAKKIEEAGADALELNIFIPPTDMNITCSVIEDNYIEIVKAVNAQIKIPISVKMGYYFTNISRMAYKLAYNNVAGLVMFNRYYRPDVDIENLRIIGDNKQSSSDEITLAIRWIALLSQKIKCDLIGNTGIYDYTGVIKHLLCGANAVQICSTLYQNGIGYLEKILTDISSWMEGKGYSKISDFRSLLSKTEEARASFDRLQFMQKSIHAY